MQQAKVQKLIEKTIKNYIDENIHLFKTDTPFVIACGLKPRLIDLAVQEACLKCKEKGLIVKSNNIEECNKFFDFAAKYAIYYMSFK